MELLIESNKISKDRILDLLKEANEIVAMTVTSIKTARHKTEKK
jgi:hypothetical protein